MLLLLIELPSPELTLVLLLRLVALLDDLDLKKLGLGGKGTDSIIPSGDNIRGWQHLL